jgi:hypothetical protein
MKTTLPFITLITVLFSVSFLNAQEIQINQSFSCDTVFRPFSGSTPVYSLSMTGNVNLYSDSGLVRVVLIDDQGNHTMVFESYPLITHENSFDTLDASDETTFLDGVVCDSLRIDLVNASLELNTLKLDTNYIPGAIELQAQAKWDHDSVKIIVMNQRIAEEHMYWRAGRTSRVNTFSYEKESVYGRSYNLLGWEYYKGGIFERINYRVQKGTYISQYVPEFDWRNRHGANVPNTPYFDGENTPPGKTGTGWITPIKDQNWPTCGSCYIFSAVGAVEARKNLYYNTHNPNSYTHNDIDISEQDILSCDYVNCGNNWFTCDGGWPNQVLNYLRDYTYTVDEECFPYETNPANSPDDVPCSSPPKCTDPDFGIKITNQVTFPMPITNPDELKHALITEGPLAGTVNSIEHAMTLVGYSSAYPDQIVYQGTGPDDPDIILDEYCNFFGETWWIYKESQGQPEAWWYSTNDFNDIANAPHSYLTGPLLFDNYEPDAQCTDEDGDGYYWWGISQTTPCSTCPPGINQQEDCDDNNPNYGPYNLNLSTGLLLYECTPLCEYKINEPEFVRASTTWDQPRHFNRNVIVDPGVTLTISQAVTFAPLAKLVIKPGALVILENGAKLTTSSNCSGLWRGVELWGYYDQPQSPAYQGKVEIEEGGTIENAWYGIRNFWPDYNPEGGGSQQQEVGHPTGGIIFASGAIFRNNKIAVKFYPYPQNNTGYFHNCTFITDDLLENNQNPDCFIRLDGVSGVEIKDCIFENVRPKNENPFGNRGKGIYCFNSELSFPETSNTNSFNSLDYGIYALNGSAAPVLNITNCDLHDNQHGVYLSGFREVGYVDVKNNQFSLGGANRPDGTSYMLYLDNCSGYKVRNNSLYVDPGSYGYSDNYIGIIVHNSGPENNWIYRNTFSNLTVSIQSQNQNRQDATPALTGLRLLCNNYCNEKPNQNSDIRVTYDENTTNWINGVAHEQKNIDPNIWFATQEPAGNTFTFTPGPYHYDIDIDADGSVNSIKYYHHPDVPGLKVEPTLFSNPLKVTTNQINIAYDPSYSCPEQYYPPFSSEEMKDMMIQADNKIDSLTNLLLALVDDGSTDTLNTEIFTSFPNQSYDVYQDLLNASPYLSDTVLKTSIYKEDVLPNVMIRDIMVANPHSAKDDNILTALDNRQNPMPDSLWTDILEGRDTVGAKEILESDLNSWLLKKDMSFNRLIEIYRNDTIHSWASDSLVAFLQNEQTLKSQYNLVFWYIENKQFSQANSVLQSIPVSFSLSTQESSVHQKFTLLLPVLEQLYIDSIGFLCPDSTQTSTLMQLIANVHDLPGNYARNILFSHGLMSYQEPVVTGATLKSIKRFHRASETPRNESFMKVFPNPCNDYIIVEYLNKNKDYTGYFELYNISGKKLISKRIFSGYDQTIIPLNDVEPGLYYLYLAGKNGKEVVNKIIKTR